MHCSEEGRGGPKAQNMRSVSCCSFRSDPNLWAQTIEFRHRITGTKRCCTPRSLMPGVEFCPPLAGFEWPSQLDAAIERRRHTHPPVLGMMHHPHPHSLLKGVHWVKDKHIYQLTNSIFNSDQNTILRVNINKREIL